jgi:DNA-binding PadR family transcriptional regulator
MAAGTASFRYLVLGLITQKPVSGDDIRQFLRHLSWLIGGPSYDSLYPTLRRLLQYVLVAVDVDRREAKPPRKVYALQRQAEPLCRTGSISQPCQAV